MDVELDVILRFGGSADLKLVYGRADGMPNSLQSMVVCDRNVCYSGT